MDDDDPQVVPLAPPVVNSMMFVKSHVVIATQCGVGSGTREPPSHVTKFPVSKSGIFPEVQFRLQTFGSVSDCTKLPSSVVG